MAVITALALEHVQAALANFDLGAPVAFAPASLGIENTNYFVSSRESDGREHQLVLTLLETDNNHNDLLEHLLVRLEQQGLPVPAPLPSRNGERTGWLLDRPALLSPCLPGEHVLTPGPEHCAAIGRFLARMHQAAAPLAATADRHPRDPDWLHCQAAQYRTALSPADRNLLDRAIGAVRHMAGRADAQCLPSGIVHGDLFRDNALFNRFGLSGVLDFHHAARHWLAFDLAVVLNDWCSTAAGSPDQRLVLAVLRAYHRLRPLTAQELQLLPVLMVWGALCFWLARLPAWLGHAGADAPRKDPADQRAIVAHQLAQPLRLDPALLAG